MLAVETRIFPRPRPCDIITIELTIHSCGMVGVTCSVTFPVVTCTGTSFFFLSLMLFLCPSFLPGGYVRVAGTRNEPLLCAWYSHFVRYDVAGKFPGKLQLPISNSVRGEIVVRKFGIRVTT